MGQEDEEAKKAAAGDEGAGQNYDEEEEAAAAGEGADQEDEEEEEATGDVAMDNGDAEIIRRKDADDIERGDEHGDDGDGVFLIWGGTDSHACAVTLSPHAFCLYIINVILQRYFDLGGYEANPSEYGQTNSVDCIPFDASEYGLHSYRLHITCSLRKFEMTYCCLTKIVVVLVAMTQQTRANKRCRPLRTSMGRRGYTPEDKIRSLDSKAKNG